jgi:hypothetical protein
MLRYHHTEGRKPSSTASALILVSDVGAPLQPLLEGQTLNLTSPYQRWTFRAPEFESHHHH